MSIKSQIAAIETEWAYALTQSRSIPNIGALLADMEADLVALRPLQEVEEMGISNANVAFDLRDMFDSTDEAFDNYYVNVMDTLTERGWTSRAQIQTATDAFKARRAELQA